LFAVAAATSALWFIDFVFGLEDDTARKFVPSSSLFWVMMYYP